VSDFFAEVLTAEQIAGQAAKEWRAEGEAKGRAEGEAKGRAEGEAKGRAEGMIEALGMMLVYQASCRFGAEKLPDDLKARLEGYTMEQLTVLAGSLATSPTFEEWLANFPA
jgi:predicted transposase YdaD